MSSAFTTVNNAQVGILMGSDSDWATMSACSDTLKKLGIAHECNAISAHRHPSYLEEYLASAHERGVEVFICAAGGAAHLAGVVASQTDRPVLACPMKGWALEGLDALLSMVQMPKGVPVATFAIGKHGAINAALFAAAILARFDDSAAQAWQDHREQQSATLPTLPTDT